LRGNAARSRHRPFGRGFAAVGRRPLGGGTHHNG
jgi:hypothetical protein